MKKKFALFLLWVAPLFLSSQNENRKWYFGNKAGLDFSTSPPTILLNSSMTAPEGAATICDGTGALLFYTEGVTVYDNTHAVMANGGGLLGNNSPCQSVIILKKPGSSTLYYIFTMTGVSGINGLNYSIVDMSLAAGLGSVTVKNAPLYNAPCYEKIVAAQHCNGRDYWILTHDLSSSNFRAHLLTSAGVNTVAVISSIGTAIGMPYSLGCIKISPNGRKLGMTEYTGAVDLFDFDNSSGIVTNSLALAPGFSSYGCEFSPDGTKFYAGGFGGHLRQWDICAGTSTAIIASQYSTTTTGIWSMQLAVDGKIYCAKGTTLGVISNPNGPGAACGYIDLGQSIAPRSTLRSIPNYIPISQKPPIPNFTYATNCNTVSFNSPAISNTIDAGCTVVLTTPTNVVWSFGEPSAGATNTSTAINPSHSYSAAGTYSVELLLYGACSVDTLRSLVTVSGPPPNLSIAGTFTVCKGEKRIYTVSGASSYTWHTTGVNTTTISLTTPTITTTYSVSGVLSGTNSCVSKKTFTLTVAKCTALEHAAEKERPYSIYPNPSDGTLFIETDTDMRIKILDKSGITIMERTFESGKHDLDIRSFSNGIYTVQCFTKKGVFTSRLVKIE